ncbi:uncharacterized protein MKK02DRAFT_32505 [Dioszegia hungarica]|uniref:CARDB domain-containing protein n=1 Tax=Dioszegia hungarica TaxID=4972 RepID=A0AA38HC38_9TREE|nr:uncharacterized protein MKK02DRAFT_32505 [Dioszegia hungarica]KAI9637720.1 hypothetical protein MKK02DRAFT_32505 [Dioszegia hungarica]
MLVKLAILFPLLASVIAAPVLSARQDQEEDDNENRNTIANDDDGVIFSPRNGSSIARGSTFNFTYSVDDEDTTRADIALIRYVRVGGDIAASGADGSRSVNTQLTLPAGIASGRYLLAVDEVEGDGDDEDEETSVGNDWSEYDLVTATNNGVKSPYWINVARPSTRRSLVARQQEEDGGGEEEEEGDSENEQEAQTANENDRDNDREDLDDDSNDENGDGDSSNLLSPSNGTAIASGATFNFNYACDGDCQAVRLALVRFYRVLNNTAVSSRDDQKYIRTTITLPATLPAANYVLAVRERDGLEDEDEEENDRSTNAGQYFDRYFDYDINFKSFTEGNVANSDDGRFVIRVVNGTTTA